MKIWRNTPLDVFLVLLSMLQLVSMFWMAESWAQASLYMRGLEAIGLVGMITYNIIVISHVFTHAPWFHSKRLNGLVSMLNSINIGQSVQIYELKHVRNHHRYNNDQIGSNGQAKDYSSTYADGKNGEHDSVFHYAFVGSAASLLNFGKTLFSVFKLSQMTVLEKSLQPYASRSPGRQRLEARQIYFDSVALMVGLSIFVMLSWQWVCFCYLPCFYIALALVNIQNYYEHFGADPKHPFANSISYYGKLYNWFTFNDGHHQEHHLKPASHWRDLPKVRQKFQKELSQSGYVVSPVPAIVGFLDKNRPLLHHRIAELIPSDMLVQENAYENTID